MRRISYKSKLHFSTLTPIFHLQYQMCAGFYHTKQFSNFCAHQLGVLKFNSDTIYLEITQTLQGKGSIPQDRLHFRYLSQV